MGPSLRATEKDLGGSNVRKNLLIAFLSGVALSTLAYAADPEMFVGLVSGSYAQTTKISVGTAADVALVSADAKRVDTTCRNNSAFTIYIGTDSATTTLTDHGFPVKQDEVFELAAFSDAIYAIASGGTADVRCWQGAHR